MDFQEINKVIDSRDKEWIAKLKAVRNRAERQNYKRIVFGNKENSTMCKKLNGSLSISPEERSRAYSLFRIETTYATLSLPEPSATH